MGCDDTREDLEEKIVYATLERDQIRKQRKILLDQLRVSTGEEIYHEPIPDYIDIEHIKEQKRKRIQKQIKKAVKEEEQRKKEEEKKQKEIEEEIKRLEKFGYDEEFLYQPLNLKVKNKQSDIDDIYDLNYVLKKKEEDKKQDIDIEDENNEQINELKENLKKKKSILKKSKKVKFNDEVMEINNEDENNGIDNDIIQKVDVKIATKTGSISSVLGDNKNKISKNKISKNNSVIDDDSAPYYTPHLQPND